MEGKKKGRREERKGRGVGEGKGGEGERKRGRGIEGGIEGGRNEWRE